MAKNKENKKKADLKDFWSQVGQAEKVILVFSFITPFFELLLKVFLWASLSGLLIASQIFYAEKSLLEFGYFFELIAKMSGSRIIYIDAFYLIMGVIGLSTFYILIFFFYVYIRYFSGSFLCEKMAYILKKKYFESLIVKSLSWREKNAIGDLPVKFNSDIETIKLGFGDNFYCSLKTIYVFVIFFLVSMAINPQISTLMHALCICLFFLLKSIDGLKNDQDSIAFSASQEIISNIKIILTFGGIHRERSRYLKNINSERKKYNWNALMDGFNSAFLIMTISSFFSIFVLVLFHGNKRSSSLDIDFINVLWKFISFVAPMFSIITLKAEYDKISAVKKAKISGSTIFNTIKAPSEIDPFQDGYIVRRNYGHIEFKNITFKYPTRSKPILKNLTLTIPSGKSIALVGPSGSGKSTLMKLIQRFYDPQKGLIEVEGVELTSLNLPYYRKQIGYVGQEPVLFSGSIYDNISQGINAKGKLGLKEIMFVCKMANAHDFIMKLPDQYDTMVGENGMLLSGGQKQRISIARAIINDPPILLLDEATSALDTTSERIVQDALNNISTNKTTIIIAHRLSTIRNVDTIIVMKDGEIVEMGNHDELIGKKGLYFDLVKSQEIFLNPEAVIREKEVEQVVDEETYLLEDEEKEIILDTKENIVQYTLNYYIVYSLACLLTMINGVCLPLFGYTLARFFNDLRYITKNQYLIIPNWSMHHTDLFLIAGFAGVIGHVGSGILFKILENNIKRDLQHNKFSSILSCNMEFFDQPQNSTGILCTKLENDTKKASSLVTYPSIFVFHTLGGLIFCFSVCAFKSMSLLLSMLASLLIISISRFFLDSRLEKRTLKGKKMYEKITQISMEVLGNSQTITSFALEELYITKFKKINKECFKLISKFNKVQNWSLAFVDASYYIFILLAIAPSPFIVKGRDFLDICIIVILTVVFFGSDILGNMSYISNYKISLASSKEYFKKATYLTNHQGQQYKQVQGKVETKDLCFSYSTRKEYSVLKGLHLAIEAKKNIGVVGPSGCGKSTLMALILSFYEADSGQIIIDNLDDWALSKLRQEIGFVDQMPKLFDASIYENILYGKPDASMEEIVEAATITNAHDFITNLPKGYDTNVGDKGGALSGGQKQRIAIARAMVRNPKILILDEATSALDSFSEQLVQKAIENASRGRTTFSIAHRLASIQNCDLIIVLNEGKLHESGTHQELLDKRGVYYTLATQQNLD